MFMLKISALLSFTTLLLSFSFSTLNAKTLTDQVFPSVKPKQKKILTDKEKAKTLPLYDLGIASINSYNPDYPGSSESSLTPLIFPTFTYRGKHFRSDGDGSRARLLNSEKLEISMSFGGNFPVNSDDNKAREGMKNLGLVTMFGPRLLYFLYTDSQSKLYFDLALRTGFAGAKTWRGWRGMGFTGDLGINYRYDFGTLEVFSLLFASFGSYEYHKFFYGVNRRYETASRRAYNAKSGYMGTNLILAFTKTFTPKFSIFAGGSLVFLKGHQNRKSPLFEKDFNYRAVLGIKYTILISEEQEYNKFF